MFLSLEKDILCHSHYIDNAQIQKKTHTKASEKHFNEVWIWRKQILAKQAPEWQIIYTIFEHRVDEKVSYKTLLNDQCE